LYSWSQVLNGGSTVSLLDFVDKIMFESLRAWFFLYLPLLYMGRTPLVSLLYNSFDYLSKTKKTSNIGGTPYLIFKWNYVEAPLIYGYTNWTLSFKFPHFGMTWCHFCKRCPIEVANFALPKYRLSSSLGLRVMISDCMGNHSVWSFWTALLI